MTLDELNEAYLKALAGSESPSLTQVTLGFIRKHEEKLRPDLAKLLQECRELPDETIVQVTSGSCGVLVDEAGNPLEFA